MSTRYLIADYLNDEQRRRILAAEYLPNDDGVLLTADGCCPLEVAFGLEPSRHMERVLLVIGNQGRAAAAAASEFMIDVDCGVLTPTDLPVAIGATSPTPTPAERQEG